MNTHTHKKLNGSHHSNGTSAVAPVETSNNLSHERNTTMKTHSSKSHHANAKIHVTDSPAPVESPQSPSAGMVTTLQGWVTALGLGPTLSLKEMRAISWGLNVPTDLVLATLATAEKFPAYVGGSVDVSGIRSSLTRADELEAVAAEARSFVAHLDDEVRRIKAAATAEGWATYELIRGVARTAKGTALRESARTLRTLAKGLKGRRHRVPKPGAPPPEAAPPEAPTAPAHPADAVPVPKP